MKLYIDFSTLTLWRLCPQKFIFNSKLNLQGGNTDALNFGTLMHLGVELLGISKQEAGFSLPSDEAIYNEIEALAVEKQVPDCRTVINPFLKVLHQLTDEASQYPLFNIPSDERRSLKHALTLTAAYAKNYANEDLKYKGFEHKFEIFLGKTAKGHEVYYRGTIDGLTKDSVIERKTTYDLNAFTDLLSPNYQAVGYVWAAREISRDINLSTVIFDGISTKGFGKSAGAANSVSSRWTIYTKPQDLFLRSKVKVTDYQIEAWKAQTLKDADRILEDYASDAVSRNAPAACQAYNTKCAYKAICMSGSKEMEQTIINSFAKQTEVWQGFEIQEDK